MGLLFVEDNGMVNLRCDNERLHSLHGQDLRTKVGPLAPKYINIFLCHISPKIWKICPKKEEREFFIGPDSPSSSKFTEPKRYKNLLTLLFLRKGFGPLVDRTELEQTGQNIKGYQGHVGFLFQIHIFTF